MFRELLQRGALTWSMEATIRTWEQAAMLATHCWLSESRNPGPSMLWTRMQTKQSSTSRSGLSRKVRRSDMDLVLNGCWLLHRLPEVVFCRNFTWSQRSSASVITTWNYKSTIADLLVLLRKIVHQQHA